MGAADRVRGGHLRVVGAADPAGHGLPLPLHHIVLTGAVMGDWLPITGQSFSRALNATGTGSCALNSTGDALTDSVNVAAVLARKAVLWVLQDGAVVWNGLVLDWQHQSILDGTLPLNCADLSYVLSKRVINTTLTYTNEDIFDIARNLVGYALGKTPNGIIANLTFSGGESGIKDSMKFESSQRQDVLSALNTLVSTYGIEWAFRPYQDAGGNFLHLVRPGVPGSRRAVPAEPARLPVPRQPARLQLHGDGQPERQPGADHGAEHGQLRGHPHRPGDGQSGPVGQATHCSSSRPAPSSGTWTSNDQVAAYATGYLPSVTDTQLTPLLTLPGGAYPAVAQTVLGSYAQVSLTSWLHPAKADGAPGFTGVGRLTGWTLTPPSAQQTENTQVQLGRITMTGDPGDTGYQQLGRVTATTTYPSRPDARMPKVIASGGREMTRAHARLDQAESTASKQRRHRDGEHEHHAPTPRPSRRSTPGRAARHTRTSSGRSPRRPMSRRPTRAGGRRAGR